MTSMPSSLRISLVLILSLCLNIGQSVAYGQDFCTSMLEGAGGPVPMAAEEIEDFLFDYYDRFELFPQIDIAMIKNLQEIPTARSSVNARKLPMYIGKYKNRNVIVKTLRTEIEGITEPTFLSFLNRHGLAVKFHGLAQINGAWAIVMDKVEGQRMDPQGYRSADQLNQIKAQAQKLLDLQVNPVGLEFMFSGDEVILIDTGLFQPLNGKTMTVDQVLRREFIW